MCQQTKVSLKCQIYAMFPNYSISLIGGMPIYMWHVKSLQSSMWWEVLYTEQWWQHWQQWWCSPTESSFGQSAKNHWPVWQSNDKYIHIERLMPKCDSSGCDLAKSNQPIMQKTVLQDYHILWKWKLSKNSPIRSTTPSQSEKLTNISPLKITTPFPNWKLTNISQFKIIKSSQNENWQISFLSRSANPPRMKTDKNQSFQEWHTYTKTSVFPET